MLLKNLTGLLLVLAIGACGAPERSASVACGILAQIAADGRPFSVDDGMEQARIEVLWDRLDTLVDVIPTPYDGDVDTMRTQLRAAVTDDWSDKPYDSPVYDAAVARVYDFHQQTCANRGPDIHEVF